ncbi:MAG: S8 family serine peptidase [Ignavibacteriales bacterium]|nr:S8 family serine peptidase [Ignavibacteriales bacterium]
MKKAILLFLFLFGINIFSQNLVELETPQVKQIPLITESKITLNSEQEDKVLSGKLIIQLERKLDIQKKSILGFNDPESFQTVVIYMKELPSADQVNELNKLGVECYLGCWTPPLENHPLGFFLAKMPANKFSETINLEFIKKMDTAEYENLPHNNVGTQSIKADLVWNMGFTGTGVKIAVLDSGIDTTYKGTEFPSTFQKMDYSNYPTLDPGVENTATGHGTHVAGTALGRGSLSVGHTGYNGTGPFKGAAPDADLIFLKIGADGSGGASGAAIIGAINDAVTIYNTDIITMSYGGWYAHHDGSSSNEQKVDWAYSQGVACFMSAGNDGARAWHYSGTVPANGSTGFIQLNAASNNSTLTYNLVWDDGIGVQRDLYQQYYNSSYGSLTTIQESTTESSRGTQSKYSYHNFYVSAGTYFTKVFNNSSSPQVFHIYYDNWGSNTLTFASPDPYYTIGQPSSADNAFAVGAYVSRTDFMAYNGTGPYWYGASYVLDQVAPFSSRGPRIDGTVKPNITAPGHVILSVRDTKVYTSANTSWIDNDGVYNAGAVNYYQMVGTSMACPMCAGAAALYLQKFPNTTPQQLYNALQNNAETTGLGAIPNGDYGYGKLNIYNAMRNLELMLKVFLQGAYR